MKANRDQNLCHCHIPSIPLEVGQALLNNHLYKLNAIQHNDKRNKPKLIQHQK